MKKLLFLFAFFIGFISISLAADYENHDYRLYDNGYEICNLEELTPDLGVINTDQQQYNWIYPVNFIKIDLSGCINRHTLNNVYAIYNLTICPVIFEENYYYSMIFNKRYRPLHVGK